MRYAIALVLLLSALSSPPVRAAESYDNCTGYIDSLPAILTTQGTWCLRADLSTALAWGIAIEVEANNITIDCNHFKIGGLAAGMNTAVAGIHSSPRLNTTIRNCNIRGFLDGVYLQGGGIVIEDSRFEANRRTGIFVTGDGNVVRRNLVLDTGGTLYAGYAGGIYSGSGQVLIEDNVVNGVVKIPTPEATVGILLRNGQHALVRGNYVTGLTVEGVAKLVGIVGINMTHTLVRDNFVTFIDPTDGYGVGCEPAGCACKDNVFMGPDNAFLGCADLGGNSYLP